MISHTEDRPTNHAGERCAFDPANVECEGERLVAEDLGTFDRCGGGGVREGVRGCSDETRAVKIKGLRGAVGGPGVEKDVQVRMEVDVGML